MRFVFVNARDPVIAGLLAKAHIRAYVRKDGVRVSEHEDRRPSAKPAHKVLMWPEPGLDPDNRNIRWRVIADPNRPVRVTDIAGGAFGDTQQDTVAVRKRAQAYLKKLRDAQALMGNDDTGWRVGLSTKGIRELTAFDASKLNLLLALPRITKNAVLVKSELSRKDRHLVKEFHTLYAPVRVNGDRRVARLVVREDVNGHFAYDLEHSCVLKSNNPGVTGIVPHTEGGVSQRQPGPSVISISSLQAAIKADARHWWEWRDQLRLAKAIPLLFLNPRDPVIARLLAPAKS